MHWRPKDILSILDECCANFTFPMLDNGYLYPAATRLSLYRTERDWGIVIEVFGYSPRAGLPDINLYTFASTLHNRDLPEKYNSPSAHANYLKNNPHNESRFVFPIEPGTWEDTESREFLARDASEITVRDRFVKLPALKEYGRHGIELMQTPQVQIFELCRFLADVERERVLASPKERRVSLPPDMKQVLQLEEWNHPDVVNNDLPSQSEAFQQLAEVLVQGDPGLYRPTRSPNTHWRNWPEGGTL